MKKVLFATTALVASAGIAAADAHLGVALTGSAEIGIVGGSRYTDPITGDDPIQFHSDIDVTFTLSGETDNGLTFGATIDLDEVGDGACGIGSGDGISETFACDDEQSVFISGNFGTITMGDTDGAFDWALQELDVIGDINDSNTSHAGFNGNGGLDGIYDGQVARYDYSFGDFAFAVSAEIDDTGTGDPAFGIGGKYSGDLGGVTLGVGIGYQTVDSATATDATGALFAGTFDAEAIGISLDAQFDNGIRGILNYTSFSTPTGFVGFDEHIGVGLFYSMDAISVGVNYGQYTSNTSAVFADSEGFGLAANYDLGGGARVAFGYGQGDFDDGTGTGTQTDSDTFSLGVSMSF